MHRWQARSGLKEAILWWPETTNACSCCANLALCIKAALCLVPWTVLDNVRLPLDEFTILPDEVKELVALAKLKLVGLGAAAQKAALRVERRDAKTSCHRPGRWRSTRASCSSMNLRLDSTPVTSAGLDLLIKELSSSFSALRS